jgi:hypothetical protein
MSARLVMRGLDLVKPGNDEGRISANNRWYYYSFGRPVMRMPAPGIL